MRPQWLWQRVTTLINSGAQVSSMCYQFCKDLTLQIQTLGRLLELEGTGGSAIPYLGYIQVNLWIPGIKNYNEDILLLVIPTMTYSEKVPVMVGSKIIDQAMGVITKGSSQMQPQPGDRIILGLSCLGCYNCPTLAQTELGWKRRQSIPPQGLTSWQWRSSAWMMSRPQFTLHGRLLSLHSVLSVYMAMPVSGDTVCRFTCWWSQHQAPSCLHQWCWLQPTESYIWFPLRYPSVCNT